MRGYNHIGIEAVNFPPTLAEFELLAQYFEELGKIRNHHLDTFSSLPLDSKLGHLATYCSYNQLSFEMYQWLNRKIGGNCART